MTAERPAPLAPDDAWLIVRRSNEHADVGRKYGIRIDGRVAGHVSRGGQLMLRVPLGTHTVDAVIDWCGSQQLTLTFEPGSRTVLRVAGKHKGWRVVFLLVFAIFGHRDYLVLEVEDDAAAARLPPQRPRTMVVRPPATT